MSDVSAEPDLLTVLQELFEKSGERVSHVFKALDADGSGTLSRKEFRRGLLQLELPFKPDAAAINAVFDLADPDGSGSIDYRELNKVLRHHVAKEALDPTLQAGAAGEIETATTNKRALRKEKTADKSAFITLESQVGEDGEISSEEMQAALRDALKANATRIIDLFKEWDEDGDGQVSRAEFTRALPMLGLSVDAEMAGSLFDAFDPDGSGDIGYKEFAHLLHNKDEAALQESIKKAAERNAALKRQAKPKLKREDTQMSHFALRKGPMAQSTIMQGLDIDEGGDKSVAEQLREALTKNAVRVIDLFKEWDDDGDGTVSKKEFRRAMPLIGFDVPKKDIDALFDSWDPDHSGTIELSELNHFLRRGGEAGGAGKIEMEKGNKHALRKGLSQGGSKFNLKLSADKPVQEQLMSLLTKNAVRVIDLFKEWDEDGDGTVSKKEFRKAIPALGVQCPRAEVDALFDSFDPDGSGTIEYAEFNKLLRRGQTMSHVTAQPPKPLWTGPLLPPRALLLVLGPNAPEKAALCRRLAHNFGGVCLVVEALAEKEVEAASELGAEVRLVQREGNALPPAMMGTLVRLAAQKQRGPFILQDWPRSLPQLYALEAAVGKAPLAIELRVPGRADAGLAPLCDEFSARGRLLQLKAHSDTLTLLKQVEQRLSELKDASALRKQKAQEEKAAAAAEANKLRRAELEDATRDMAAARRQRAAAEAAALAQRQREQFAAHQGRAAQQRELVASKRRAAEELAQTLHARAQPPVVVTFSKCAGGTDIVPGSTTYLDLQARWGRLHKQLSSDALPKGLHATARKYQAAVPVMSWQHRATRSTGALPRLRRGAGDKRGSLALPPVARPPPGDDPRRASFVNRSAMAPSASAPALGPAAAAHDAGFDPVAPPAPAPAPGDAPAMAPAPAPADGAWDAPATPAAPAAAPADAPLGQAAVEG